MDVEVDKNRKLLIVDLCEAAEDVDEDKKMVRVDKDKKLLDVDVDVDEDERLLDEDKLWRMWMGTRRRWRWIRTRSC